MLLVVYRIVLNDPPTEFDFTTNAAKGLSARGLEEGDPILHDSISVYGKLKDARNRQQSFPQLGSYIAELEVDIGHQITVYQLPKPPSSHYSLRGIPAAFLRCVQLVIPPDRRSTVP